ncbi:MAG: NAD(P)H-quinone oxidoreductase [Rhodospirillaceae bacterium]|jgi:NADPH:quinone reductase|nr:NAD(P)H-quinone oxidoreductase [Rhodospirillaceae bacterium]MBT6202944.1 NAD(P)H-quinone oxidoreductase [Rhodospirillaceae bacterium]MBT6509383.1 NAD(P)H-quinone oxidoreductase [Rhodospirillaceae bacterium]MBT7646582.1 NAD(P)H-quinone oxidoreductase [Rhodospirillaceae bacterium]
MPETLPETMKVVEYDGAGGSDVVKLVSRPVPEPSIGEVLVKVHAAGINRPDLLQRAGGYPPPPGASDIPGLEIAGEVVANGPDSADLVIGDKVMALVTGGGYAEYCVVPVPQALPIPNSLSMVEAAAVPETFFTVWTNVFQRSRLQAGETLLVHGGASGIGTTAIQLAQARGSRVFVTAGSDDRCRACEALGAERGINHRTENFVAVARELTDDKGVDVVLDMIGGDYITKNINVLAVEGRLCFIAFLGGSKASLNFAPLMMKRVTITGSTLRARSVLEKGEIAGELKREVLPLLESGRVKPIIHAAFPMAEAAAAQDAIDDDHVGKVVLTMM